jgi:hypothetical protein
MVKGLDLFRERFQAHQESFVLIGGAACDVWFTGQGIPFRSTEDLDIVLVLEVLDAGLVAAIRQFIDEGRYQIRQRIEDGSPVLYRFADPKEDRFPRVLEFFTKKPELLDLRDDQRIVPVAAGDVAHSLSAILLDDAYYALLREHSTIMDGLPIATSTSLIPLKAHAWLDLTLRKNKGERVDNNDIKKHRNDVFRLAGTLPGTTGPELPDSILGDIRRFLEAFPENSPDWPAILSSVKTTLGGNPKPASLIRAIQTYFKTHPDLPKPPESPI